MRAQLVFLKSDINRALLERGSCSPPFQFGVPFNHAYIPELARKHLRTPLFLRERESNTQVRGWGVVVLEAIYLKRVWFRCLGCVW